ncbi:hypothetical protein K2173_024413 [Erythroxylum novogranatense]|uniref:non-specific serine/threonine protein kinase n=1 Tax=Erythroxylum novogranatense TaxID=1862640 RepID=A0AAV8SVB5_9ROSI|nr:hypothetical protein K2173_024413 [Erythroxylum novogranatense]
MCGEKTLVLVIEIWIYFVLLSATFGSSNLAKMNNEENPGFISIDCGVDADYIDEDAGIYFKSDSEFVSTGKNKNLQPEDGSSNPYFGKQLLNLRSFEEGTRNCYTLKPEQGRDNNYLIRAHFLYGNYDGKNQTPTFDLYLGVNFWTKVRFKDLTEWWIFEIFHFSSSDTIDVCLINTGDGGIPFISALELRQVNSSSYIGQSFSTLETLSRFDVGYVSEYNIRYKDDPYDRSWWSINDNDWALVNSSMLHIGIQENNDNNKVPVEVFRTAAVPGINRSSLSYSYTSSYTWYDLYVNLYFLEIQKILPGQRRKFKVTINGDDYGAFTLENSKPLTIRSNKSRGVVNFTINPTQDSTLPPILNAFEILRELNLTKPTTNQADVDAIMEIKQVYKINKMDWQGDPCLPSMYIWTGLSCSNNDKIAELSKIISLNLSSSSLRGEIASAFSNIRAMQKLDLSFNELTGTVPEFLGQLPNLKLLNLNGNKLSGVIPRILVEKVETGVLQLSFDGNPKLCLTAPCEKTKKHLILPIIVSIVAILVFLILSIMIIIWIMKRNRVSKGRKGSLVESKNHSFTYSEIMSITNNFRDVIGEGGFGKVYLGNLSDGTQVAVKVLSESSNQGYKEFLAEVELLLVVHHRNLVPLIGYCNEEEIMALVYEYMENGNLQQHLSETRAEAMSWEERLQVAVDAAHGLEYLHNGCKPPIIHRDFKSSNILLTRDLQAKISDFGLSRVLTTLKDTHVTTQPAGTFGYLDPTCRASGIFNKKTDTYSFGVVLLELITGQPVIVPIGDYHCHLIQWTYSSIERGDIKSIVDPKLQGEFNLSSAWKAVEIALSCVAPNARQRPDMSYVLAELKESLSLEMASGDDKSITTLLNEQDLSLPSVR